MAETTVQKYKETLSNFFQEILVDEDYLNYYQKIRVFSLENLLNGMGQTFKGQILSYEFLERLVQAYQTFKKQLPIKIFSRCFSGKIDDCTLIPQD